MVIDSAFPAHIERFPTDENWVVQNGLKIPARKLAAEGCEVVFATYPAGLTLAPHRHDDLDIAGVVTKGLVRLTIDGDERHYGPGDWFHVPTSVEHSATYEQETSQVELIFPPSAHTTATQP
ncbi:cupin domain-containing protein [Micromonospora sp. KC213]|uniref:cupin domain-containing protein n=1 Tax=Micromonospora sp. KC213 TaxID=2530378 RepID=UPI001053C3BE|nr:cupin domain-containing protein [Micromonospora sp. KC213]TDC44270.1 cupin domain-containing protein [Micromonospora sp. KC213]